MNRMIRLYGGRLFYSQAPSPKLPPPSVVKPLKSEIYYPSYLVLDALEGSRVQPGKPLCPAITSATSTSSECELRVLALGLDGKPAGPGTVVTAVSPKLGTSKLSRMPFILPTSRTWLAPRLP